MILTCIIVDDEPIAHEVLKSHCANFAEIKIVASFYNCLDAGKYLSKHSVDLMFLDVEMPVIKGLDFLRGLSVRPLTILTTAFRDYAVDGFELGVTDFLLKPISMDRLKISLNRTFELQKLMSSPGSSLGEVDSNQQILIKTGTQKVLLNLKDISHAQGLKDYTILFTTNKRYLVKGSIKFMLDFLPQEHFMRVHKSFIVALDRIRLVHKNRIDMGEIQIPVGRNYKLAVDDFLLSRSNKI
jgi:DNA-binding LytR/AlgR family response regulator